MSCLRSIRPALWLGLATASLVALPASASVITMQTRHSTATAPGAEMAWVNADYYRDVVTNALGSAPTAGYCDSAPTAFDGLSNQAHCGGAAGSIAFAFTVDFGLSAEQGADFSLRLGPDFGHGGALFLDGQLLAVRTSDMWWGGSYASPTQVFEVIGLALDAGNHRLSLFGLEGCCDGGQQGQYRVGDDGAWTTFATGDALQPVVPLASAVPEPGTLALVLGAFAALAWRGARRRAPAAQS
jgi:hypothetical protein